MFKIHSKAIHVIRKHYGEIPFRRFLCTWKGSSRGNDYSGNDHSFHMTSRSLPQLRKLSVALIDTNTNSVLKARLSSYACNREVASGVHKFRGYFVKNYSTMSGKGPGLIVFDLDCTLWPLHVDTTVNPPFIKTDSKIVDQDGKLITYYPEVPQVLEYLKAEGYPIGVASRTTKPPGAYQLLDFFDWNKYISYREIYPGSKVTHFTKFVEQTGLPRNQMLFFDDEERNIIDMKKEGVKCIFVENGVDLKLVKDSIEKFKNGQL